MSLFLVAIFVVFLAWVFLGRKKRPGKKIPGPFAWPVVGNLFSLERAMYKSINRWAEEYGNIFQIYLGPQSMVFISDAELIRKALQHPALQARPVLEVFNEISNGAKGIQFTKGAEWQEQRRFILRHLRDFGLGKTSLDVLILREVNEFMDWLKANEGRGISLQGKFNLAILNTLWMMVTGNRHAHDDPELQQAYHKLITVGQEINLMMVMFAPKLAKMFPDKSGWNKALDTLNDSVQLVKRPVDEHKRTFTPDNHDNPRDFIDAYISQIKNTRDPQSSFYGDYGYESLQAVAATLFQAGSHTTSATITWAVLYLAIHPEVQKKFQDEIDAVVGKNRQPTLLDKNQMKYTEAIINETLRKSSLAPHGGHHMATEDVVFEGYFIPKGTTVMGNMQYVHNRPEIWGDPDKFRPERFLDNPGLKEFLYAFSVGKRVCVGEILARDEIFLFLTCVFQKFNVTYDPSEPKPTMEPRLMFQMLEAPEYKIVLTDRLQS